MACHDLMQVMSDCYFGPRVTVAFWDGAAENLTPTCHRASHWQLIYRLPSMIAAVSRPSYIWLTVIIPAYSHLLSQTRISVGLFPHGSAEKCFTSRRLGYLIYLNSWNVSYIYFEIISITIWDVFPNSIPRWLLWCCLSYYCCTNSWWRKWVVLIWQKVWNQLYMEALHRQIFEKSYTLWKAKIVFHPGKNTALVCCILPVGFKCVEFLGLSWGYAGYCDRCSWCKAKQWCC